MPVQFYCDLKYFSLKFNLIQIYVIFSYLKILNTKDVVDMVGRVYEDNDGVVFEDSKKAIQIKLGISFNALKYNTLQIGRAHV